MENIEKTMPVDKKEDYTKAYQDFVNILSKIIEKYSIDILEELKQDEDNLKP